MKLLRSCLRTSLVLLLQLHSLARFAAPTSRVRILACPIWKAEVLLFDNILMWATTVPDDENALLSPGGHRCLASAKEDRTAAADPGSGITPVKSISVPWSKSAVLYSVETPETESGKGLGESNPMAFMTFLFTR